ncbi:hypothetical protein [Dictyobacter aurantiacus]|uniref:Uncharacterized protein n=1 Tax=Dictyobacter aurantiacus TaxID=1936993 RepID=A0A401ZRU8_9CHLR|nr:hypothetical protein [Dictyobacter aurantiacus]GCE09648.1 hypothetical protein KDAU_69770 [Dictyobacter aurantiacus]
MDIFMRLRQAGDVADQETMYLPAPVQRVEGEPDTLLEVTAALYIPTNHTPREMCVTTLVSSTPPLREAPESGQKEAQDVCSTPAIISALGDTHHLYTLQALRPTPSLLDTLGTIEDLCKLFLRQRGSPPVEISLHWQICLELLAWGHSSFCLTLPDEAARDGHCARCVVCIPFAAGLTGDEHMIMVRGG